MIRVKPEGIIELKHRAFFLRGRPNKSIVIAASGDGQFSVLSPDLKKCQFRRLSRKIRGISPHPSKDLFAWIDGDSGSLIVQRLGGGPIVEISPPLLHNGASNWIKPGFDDCFFETSGKFLWLVGPRSDHESELQLVETAHWSLVDKTMIKDPFRGSSCSFEDSGRPDLLWVWTAAGGDGNQVFWLKRKVGGFSCTLEPQLTNTGPPAFSPGGKHILVVSENCAICKFRFPEMRQIGTCLESEDEDDPYAESLAFLNERQGLARTNEGRLFLIDAGRMKSEGELALEGHEPGPKGKYYPNLKNEKGICTDISYFSRLGDVVFFVYQRERAKELLSMAGWKDSLLWLSVDSLV
jgi:hypothetical protein